MPLYDYACRACGNEFEEIATPDAQNGVTCPACGSTDTDRQMSAHSPIPGSGTNRIPGSLMRGGGAKMEQVPMQTKKLKKPIPKTACPRPGGCSGCGPKPS